MTFRITTIIVTYNGLKWIDKCLKSLLSSDFKIKIIVIDNLSIDGTPEYISKNFPSVCLVKLKENVGFGKANNIGISRAYNVGSDYFFLLNQDAWVEANTIPLLMNAHQLEPGYDLISPIHLDCLGNKLDYNFSNYIGIRACPQFISDVVLNKTQNKLYEINFVNAACWLLTRKCIEQVGGFNPLFFHYGEDNNYIDRLHYHGLKAAIYPNAIIYHDREQVNKGKYFDETVVLDRNKLLSFLNPSTSDSIHKEIAFKTRQTKKYLLTLRFASAIRAFGERALLKRNSTIYVKNIEESLQRMAFLQNHELKEESVL